MQFSAIVNRFIVETYLNSAFTNDLKRKGFFRKMFIVADLVSLSDHSKTDKTKSLMTNGSLMKVESIAECSPWSILQYFQPALCDNWSWKPILVYFLDGRLRQVLLYAVQTLHK